jgi:hypothetical protein
MIFSKTKIIYLISFLFLTSCISVRKADDLEDGYYSVNKNIKLQNPDGSEVTFSRNEKIFIEDHIDSLILHKKENGEEKRYQYLAPYNNPLCLKQRTFDVDIFIVPFKLRPAIKHYMTDSIFPAQLNFQFSASLYMGYRWDQMRVFRRHPSSHKRIITKNGYGFGGFLGLSTVNMNPWVTGYKINEEYDGLAFTYGVSAIYAVKKFNAGLAVGFDYLMDHHRDVWIYHNRPWIGLLVGLNLK